MTQLADKTPVCACCEAFPCTPPLRLCALCREAVERMLKRRRKNYTGKAPLMDRILP